MRLEERFAHAGAKIDALITVANKTKKVLIQKEETACKHTLAALDELNHGLDNAWHELDKAWREIRGSKGPGKATMRSHEPTCNKEQEKKRVQARLRAEDTLSRDQGNG